MKLEELGNRMKERLLGPLPGDSAHATLRATPIGETIPRFEHKLPPKPGGVLILLYEHGGQLKFPVIKRQEYRGAHSGQISLPGGKAEAGEDAVQAALREGEEEIGVERIKLNVLGTLSDFFVVPSNFIITPVIATIKSEPFFKPDSYEVAKILTGSIDDLIKDDAIKQSELLAAGRYRMMAPYFDIEGEVVWGATAMMLNEFRVILREVFSAG
ncbi:MAG: CoA pyrophosphatase [Cyclobacteriaceae bacterium]|nr:CoA pyrophosphatase [Cyclobacteriaceae bacterium]MDH4295603.1 CoA pyrophosphatase [Cyclobacteriaceae bacterium]MDH5247727.1 CoA pyrophosphatase [Cyclobacteriaceae bacterium]